MKTDPTPGYVNPLYVADNYVVGGLFDFLLNSQTLIMADLYTLTLANNEIFRWTDYDLDLVKPVSGYIYSSSGPILRRGKTRTVIGIEIDTLDVSICPRFTDLIDGLGILSAARAGLFDGARLVLERAFLYPDQTMNGAVMLFSGRFADLTIGRTEIQARINSDVEALNTNLPRNLYQAGCVHALYDTGCGISRSAVVVSGTVTAGSTASQIRCNLAQAAGYFSRGYIAFVTGALAGNKYSVKAYYPGFLSLFKPMPSIPAVSDVFGAYPGCDKSQATCSAKFSNLANFRGCPYIPVPETAV